MLNKTSNETKRQTIYEALEEMRQRFGNRNDSKKKSALGTRFEEAICYFLKNDQIYKNTFVDVWHWNDGHDIGIDLVAKDYAGNLWAIQCKCWQEDSPISFRDLGTFFASADSRQYAHTMLVTTTSNFSRNLQKIINERGTICVTLDKIDESNLDWSPFSYNRPPQPIKVLEPRQHQKEAIEACLKEFERQNRGKLFMACGTGKTLTALRLAEELCGRGGFVLFLAPSISLVSQSLRYWANQAREPIYASVVCSDEKASNTSSDAWENKLTELPLPATTDPKALSDAIEKFKNADGLTVVFSTYQSIDVIREAQKQYKMKEFDLIICDEAHRTAAVTTAKKATKDTSAYVKIHDRKYILGKKRLYMTATPKVYSDKVKKQGQELVEEIEFCSMDNPEIYGAEMYTLSFGTAVEKGLLTDYKPIVLTMSEGAVAEFAEDLQKKFGLEVDEQARIVGCWKGLANQGVQDGEMLQSAIGFCNKIDESKRMADSFSAIIEKYVEKEKALGHDVPNFTCKAKHIDGTMNSTQRRELLSWLAEKEFDEQGNPICHILFNARCLSEGVDVPSLDAVLFLRPKKSQIDVIQAVGRVMRKSADKKYGYIIMPVVIPEGIPADEALDKCEDFSVIWGVAKALRSHDERMEAIINSLQFEKSPIQVIEDASCKAEKDGLRVNEESTDYDKKEQEELDLSSHSLQRAINARLVKKCGTKTYWEDWARDIAKLAGDHIERIKLRVSPANAYRPKGEAYDEFQQFLASLRDTLNPGISEDEAIEMLAQHWVTLPMFEALFGGNGFAQDNPISQSMDKMIAVLKQYNLTNDKERKDLDELYHSVRVRCAQVTTDTGRQKLIKELYENFFKEAFKKTSEKLGIVYTPVEIVDFILHTTNRLLQKEFNGQCLADENVHILDPFTGTGTFIQRLIASPDLIPDEQLRMKYMQELHCNEIVLLAYYIATINIESSYYARTKEICAFPGAVLTDTFQMSEQENTLDREIFATNSKRAEEQYALPITVIVGNPPYKVGQKNSNDNNQNEKYPTLDSRIAETYVKNSKATSKISLYDSYIRAFRWASDRIGDKGIVAFVSNGGWLRGSASEGVRRCLAKEFSSIYVFDLRGNGEYRRLTANQIAREGKNVFGSNSKAPITITVLVKNPSSTKKGVIRYFDIGEYLSTEEKLDIIRKATNTKEPEWEIITPDKYGDWVEQRLDCWYGLAPLSLKKCKSPLGMFAIWSRGIVTSRDCWDWSFSRKDLQTNIRKSINFYEQERKRYHLAKTTQKAKDLVQYDPTSIKWDRELLTRLVNNESIVFGEKYIINSLYRPFCKKWLYADSALSNCYYLMAQLFPIDLKRCDNLVISMTGKSSGTDFSCIMCDTLPDLSVQCGGQCFPLYYYEPIENGSLLTDDNAVRVGNYIRHDAITDETLEVFRNVYPQVFANYQKTLNRIRAKQNAIADKLNKLANTNQSQTQGSANDSETEKGSRYLEDYTRLQRFTRPYKAGAELTKEDIFFYVYGILHSPAYIDKYKNNLSKELPRIPFVKADDFFLFSVTGRYLAELHLSYENDKAPMCSDIRENYTIPDETLRTNPGRVEKMEWGKHKSQDEKYDYSVIRYNSNLILSNIPLRAQDYIVNGKTALQWIVGMYQGNKTDKESGIVDDANLYSDNPRYIVDLIKRVAFISVKSVEAINALPDLEEITPPEGVMPKDWLVCEYDIQEPDDDIPEDYEDEDEEED